MVHFPATVCKATTSGGTKLHLQAIILRPTRHTNTVMWLGKVCKLDQSIIPVERRIVTHQALIGTVLTSTSIPVRRTTSMDQTMLQSFPGLTRTNQQVLETIWFLTHLSSLWVMRFISCQCRAIQLVQASIRGGSLTPIALQNKPMQLVSMITLLSVRYRLLQCMGNTL